MNTLEQLSKALLHTQIGKLSWRRPRCTLNRFSRCALETRSFERLRQARIALSSNLSTQLRPAQTRNRRSLPVPEPVAGRTRKHDSGQISTVRPTLMGTKNLNENGPNPFFLGPKIWSESILWQRFCFRMVSTASLSMFMRGRYKNEIVEWK